MANDTFDLMVRKMEDPEGTILSERDELHFRRLQDAYTHWLSMPVLTDTKMRDYIMANYGVAKSQAYADIALVKMLFGSVALANKEQQRYKVNYLLDQAAAAAMAGNDAKAKALTKVAQVMVKNNRLEEDEGEQLPWELIKSVDISFSVDPTVIGIEKVPGIHERAAKLLKRYAEDVDGADVIEEVKDE